MYPLAPYPTQGDQQSQPEGEFPLIVCTTKERLERTLTALEAYSAVFDPDITDHIHDIRAALSWVGTPEEAPCAPCSDPDEQCISFYPSHPSFEFSPGLINGGDTGIPNGYAQHPFFTGDRYTVPGFTMLPTDVIHDLFSARSSGIGGFIQQITDSGFPRFRFTFTSPPDATIEVHLIEVPFGGEVIIRVDEGASVDIVSTNGFALSEIGASTEFILSLLEEGLEGRFTNTIVHEIEVVTEGEHVLDVLFIPQLQLNPFDPVRWGGGIRKVVICGKDLSCEQQICPECPECPECSDETPCNDCGECVECEDCSDCGECGEC